MSAWFSLPQQWLMTTWNKQTSTILAQKSVAVLWHCCRSKDKITRALQKILSAELVLCSTLHLFDLQIFFITMPQEARICRKGKILRWNKHVGQLADAVSVHCPQTNEKPRDKMRILVVVRPTIVQSSFHTEFLSFISSPPLRLLRRRKRTRNLLAFSSEHKEELKLSLSTTKKAN